MYLVITPNAYEKYSIELRNMFRLRHRVFKERLGWDVTSVDGEERDQFDDLNPVYIVVLDDQRDVIGCWRLLPTMGPYMLADVFPALMDGRMAIHDPMIWECSRFAVDCSGHRENNLAAVASVTYELFMGLASFCVPRGISGVVTVYDLRIGRLMSRVGIKPHWKTSTRRIGDTAALAGYFPVNEANVAKAAAGAIDGTALWQPELTNTASLNSAHA
ncbi:MAG: acyl-homoserine-lactone synthase [Alphaproteobacteria bacterium]